MSSFSLISVELQFLLSVKLDGVSSSFIVSLTHHVSEVGRQLLDLLKLFDLLRVQVLLQLPRRLLIRETAPLNEVMGHLLQQHKHAV